MPGAEAITSVQLIDACIGITKTILDIGRAVRDAQGLPPKLQDLLEKLPAIEELLESAHENCEEGGVSDEAGKSAQPVLKQCEAALAELRDIFRKACPKDGETRTKRVWRGAKTVFFGRDSQVQKLLVTIQENLRLLEQKEMYVIGDKLDALQQATEALVDADNGKYTHSGAGNIIANEGGNPTNYVTGGSNNRQINNPNVYHEGPATTIHNTHLPPERPETPPVPFCAIPFPQDPDFVERANLLDQIRERCAKPASRVALVGLGGVGKSQLAIEHCYRTVEHSPETWVFWVHAGNQARLDQSFREIADLVKVRGRQDQQANVFKLVHDWLRNERNGPWLVVLDNADDAAVLSPPSRNIDKLPTVTYSDGSNTLKQHLSRYLPQCRHGSVLVTSRTWTAATQLVEDSDVISVEPMLNEAAHALLHKKLGDKVGRDADDITELAAVLDHMPLALVQAAAYIRKRAPRCSVQQYLEEYRQGDRSKMSLLNQEGGHLRRDKDASNSVLLTWQISFEHMRTERLSAADLLSLMSFFDRQGIQEALLHRQSSIPDDIFEEDVLTLRDYSFISVTNDKDTFEMHSLVQLATRTWLEHQGQLNKWREQFISNLCAELPRGEYENWAKCQAIFPHARAALAQRPEGAEPLKKWALLLYNAAGYAWRRGRADEAEHMAGISMQVRSEVCGEESVETLDSMTRVGIARELRGKYKEAELVHRQTLAIREKVLGHEHLRTLTNKDILAGVLQQQGKYKEAELMYRETLVICEEMLGREHPEMLTSRHNLALVLKDQGKYEEAKLIYREVLVTSKEVLGREHPDTLMSMNNLALVLDHQGKYEEAELMYKETLVIKEKVLGPEHPGTLISMCNLARVLDHQGRYEEAETMHRKTLVIEEKVLGLEHPDTLASMNNLAAVLDSQGRYEEAESMFRQTLALDEKVHGYNHPETLTTVHWLAYLLAEQGHYKESFALYERACAGRDTVLGEDHPDSRACRQNYAEAKKRATEEQHAATLPSATSDTNVQIHTSKPSKLTRSLARLGFKRSEKPAR